MPVVRVSPVYDLEMRKLCKREYPGRTGKNAGCPNYGQRETCPPQARPLHQVMSLGTTTWVIYNKYNIKANAERLRSIHPEWTVKKCYCSRYWQATARLQLEEHIAQFLRLMRDRDKLLVLRVPEANGMNVTATMASIGIELEWPPRCWAYQVALAGYKV